MGGIIGLLGSSATPGERQIHAFLEGMFRHDPSVYCYFEPYIHGGSPDFVLFGPEFGVVTIEIKDYMEERLVEVASTGPWFKSENGRRMPLANPYDQSYKYWRAISNQLKFKGIQRAVIFTNVSRDGLIGRLIQTHKPGRLIIFFKEDVKTLEAFRQRFKESISHEYDLSTSQIEYIRGNLMPMCRVPSTNNLHRVIDKLIPVDKLRLLDSMQEELAYNLGSGHRLIFGVAGSGKTVILIARARYLAQKHDNWRILVLCYNRILSRFLYGRISPQDFKSDVYVYTFHKWAKDMIESADESLKFEYRMRM
ncbi:MAG: UvrD-helicase domain-containing protein, partial [Promethearchaeota archaeon]